MKFRFETATKACQCANPLNPRTPLGPTVRLLIDGTQRGFYCYGCLPSFLEAVVDVTANAAVNKATVKVGDQVTWSDIPMTVLEVGDWGVRTDYEFGAGDRYGWEVIERIDQQEATT